MTRSIANKKVHEIGCKETIYQILDLLNGETFSDCMEILKLTEFFIKEHSFVDSEMAKALIDSVEEDV